MLRADWSTFLSLASLLHNTGRLEEAERVFQEGLNLDPNRTDLICGLVGVHSVYWVWFEVFPPPTGSDPVAGQPVGQGQDAAGRSLGSAPGLWVCLAGAGGAEPAGGNT